jgi:hypothetical protein
MPYKFEKKKKKKKPRPWVGLVKIHILRRGSPVFFFNYYYFFNKDILSFFEWRGRVYCNFLIVWEGRLF